MNYHGILPACITPFIHDRADPGAMRANIAFWLKKEVHGVLVFGSTGEYVYLEDAERRSLLRAARQAVPAARLLLVGCGAESTAAALRYLHEAADDGADAALVVTPVYYTRGDTAAQRYHYETLAQASPIPVMLYTVPAYTAYDLDLGLILELSHHPNIVGMKESGGDLRRLILETQDSHAGFAVFAGSPNLAFSALALGAAGSITAFANIIPELMVGIWQAVQTGDTARASGLQVAVTRFGQAIGPYGIPAIKALAAHRGLAPGQPRAPLRPLDSAAMSRCIAAWEQAMQALA